MQPTMKLRWKRIFTTSKIDPLVTNGYGDDMILQQWWELEINMTQYPGSTDAKGEWRDIEMQEE